MKKLRIGILCAGVFAAAAFAGAAGVSSLPRGAAAAGIGGSAVYGELPYYLRLEGSVLSVYSGGRTEGAADRRFAVDLAPLTSEDVLRLSCGVYYDSREEYLLALESLGVG